MSGLSFKAGEARPRPPVSVDWIKGRLLAKGALDGLKDQARAILLTMVNTGARPSELAALTPACIRLHPIHKDQLCDLVTGCFPALKFIRHMRERQKGWRCLVYRRDGLKMQPIVLGIEQKDLLDSA